MLWTLAGLHLCPQEVQRTTGHMQLWAAKRDTSRATVALSRECMGEGWSRLAGAGLEKPRLGERGELRAPHPNPELTHACLAACPGSQKPSGPQCWTGLVVCGGRAPLAGRWAPGPGAGVWWQVLRRM